MRTASDMRLRDVKESGNQMPWPRILYVLPKENFFTEGRRGRVSHALGVIAGMRENGATVRVLSGPGLADHLSGNAPGVQAIPVVAQKGAWIVNLLARLRDLLAADSRPDIVIVRYAASSGFRFRRVIDEFPDIFWCFEVNSLGGHALGRIPSILREPVKFLESRVVAAADLIYVVSHEFGRDIGRHLDTGNRAKIAVVHNGGPAPYQVRYSDKKGLCFYYCGVFQSYYELDLVIEAFCALAGADIRATLHLYGDGPGMGALKQVAKDHEGIVFHGRYKMDELIKSGELSADGILVLPYRADANGSPIKLFEYMALGLPIIASDAESLRSILRDGQTAACYKAGDVASLANVMERLAADAALRKSIAANARAEYPKHTWKERMADLLLQMKSRYDQRRR